MKIKEWMKTLTEFKDLSDEEFEKEYNLKCGDIMRAEYVISEFERIVVQALK